MTGPETITDEHEDEVSRLLRQDASSTLGENHADMIHEYAEIQRDMARDFGDYVQRVVDEVQQAFHDRFIDTTWPRCPRHPNHPLWFQDGWWRCERDHVAVARLGELTGTSGAPVVK